MAADPGPMARFAEVTAAPDTMSVIVQRLTDGESLKAIAAAWQVPYGKLAEWIIENEDRATQYVRAKAIGSNALADEIVAIADAVGEGKSAAQKAKLQIEARRWVASRWDPARFGDSSRVNVAVKDDRLIDRDALLLETARSLAFILAAGAEVQESQRKPLALPPPERDVTPSAEPPI